MKKISIIGAAVAAITLTACADSAKDITAPDLQISAIKNPTPTYNPNGPVWVQGQFTLTVNIAAAGEGINAHPQGLGTCRDGDGNIGTGEGFTVWYNSQGHETNAPFCQGSGTGITSTVTCSINADGLPATYAFGTGGLGLPADDQTANNENINFHSDLIPQDTAQFVHYGAPTKKGQKGITTAKSQTAFSFTCDDLSEGDAFISLDNFNGYVGNLFTGLGSGDRRLKVELLTGIDVHMYATGDGPYTQGDEVGTGELSSLYWNFRSRN